MSTQNNDVLGYTKCEAGGRASVHRTNRGKARYLYTRCDCCGCDQRTGAAVQTRLFTTTEWLNGAPDAPPNLLTTAIQPKNEPKLQSKTEPLQPDFEPKVEAVPQPKEEPKGMGFLTMAGAALGVLGLIMSRAVR